MSLDPFRRTALAVGILAAAGLAMAAAAHREVGLRSLVPHGIDAVLVSREVRTEKHPGRDDRYYVTLRDARGERTIEMGRRAFGMLAEGDRLRKAPGERVLHASDREIPLRSEGDGNVLAAALVAGLAAPLVQALASLRRR